MKKLVVLIISAIMVFGLILSGCGKANKEAGQADVPALEADAAAADSQQDTAKEETADNRRRGVGNRDTCICARCRRQQSRYRSFRSWRRASFRDLRTKRQRSVRVPLLCIYKGSETDRRAERRPFHRLRRRVRIWRKKRTINQCPAPYRTRRNSCFRRPGRRCLPATS